MPTDKPGATPAQWVRSIAREYEAQKLWEMPGPELTGIERLELYRIPATGRLLLFKIFEGGNGWEVFTQPTLRNNVHDTRNALCVLHHRDLASQSPRS